MPESHGHATEPGPGEGTQESPFLAGERLGVQRERGGHQGPLTVATGKLSVSEAPEVQGCALETEMEDQAQRPRSPCPALPPRYCWVTIFFEPLLAGVQSTVLRKRPLLQLLREPGISPEQADDLSSLTTELTSLFLRLDERWQRPGEPRQEAGGCSPEPTVLPPRELGAPSREVLVTGGRGPRGKRC